jgi:hypothetical protein
MHLGKGKALDKNHLCYTVAPDALTLNSSGGQNYKSSCSYQKAGMFVTFLLDK